MAAMLQSRLGLPRLVHLSASPGCCKEPLAPLARGAWTTSSPALLRAAFFALTLRRAGSGSTPRRAFAAGPATAEAAEAEAEADAEAAGQGLLLVVGCSPDLAELCVPQRRFRRVLRAPPLRSPQEVEDLMALAHAEHPELEIQGLLHGGPSASSSSSSLTSPGAAEALDASLRSLALLAPVLEKLPHARLVSWSSDLGFASPASWAPQGAGMAALACNFMEQYIQALAHQMRKSGVTVYGMRFTEEAVRISLDSDQNARHQLEKEIQEVWSLPRREAHGQIFEVGRPLVSFSTQSARGGSVLGSSLDVQWALRSAVKDAASYPVDGRPATYKALADALRTAPERLVWAHGASDVILRTALAAAKRGTGDRALMQSPSWPNAASLLRAGGLKVDTVPYPDPSEGAEGGDSWELLRERLDVPPALVYLVHPHFPTGVKDPHFAESLQELLAAGAFQRSLVAVDQTYLGFTELTTDDELLESLAEGPAIHPTRGVRQRGADSLPVEGGRPGGLEAGLRQEHGAHGAADHGDVALLRGPVRFRNGLVRRPGSDFWAGGCGAPPAGLGLLRGRAAVAAGAAGGFGLQDLRGLRALLPPAGPRRRAAQGRGGRRSVAVLQLRGGGCAADPCGVSCGGPSFKPFHHQDVEGGPGDDQSTRLG
ncbi:unnamed protein product [Effrenium voratum]|nr:unnamed protein product [Effrenium voratum]